MGFFNRLFSKFVKKPKTELELLDQSCNQLFQKNFNTCRRNLGQEIIEVMNIKKSALEALQNSESGSDLKETLVKKILLLTAEYLKLAGSYANCLASNGSAASQSGAVSDIMKSNYEKLIQISSLIKSLNVQLNLNSDVSSSSDGNDIINEATALNNVLEENMKNLKDK